MHTVQSWTGVLNHKCTVNELAYSAAFAIWPAGQTTHWHDVKSALDKAKNPRAKMVKESCFSLESRQF